MYVKLHKRTSGPSGGKWWEAQTEDVTHGVARLIIRWGADGAKGG